MDLDGAIAAHVKWKVRLMMFIGGTGENLDSSTISRDDLCELGRWIHGEGTMYKNHPAYQTLVKKHASFHKSAGDVVRKVEQGDKASAEAMMGANSAFLQQSNETVMAIQDLKRAIEKEK